MTTYKLNPNANINGTYKVATLQATFGQLVAVFGMPMGVSLNMTVNGEDVVVPMVIEEPSVVAAVGNVARMTRPEGFTASSDDPIMIGQMHVRNVADPRAEKGEWSHVQQRAATSGTPLRRLPRLAFHPCRLQRAILLQGRAA